MNKVVKNKRVNGGAKGGAKAGAKAGAKDGKTIYNRDYWWKRIDTFNRASEKNAIAKFQQSAEAKCVANAEAMFNALAEAVTAVRAGKAPKQFSDSLFGEIKILLSSKTWLEYPAYIVVNPDQVDYSVSDINKFAQYTSVTYFYREYLTWMQIVSMLNDFLHDAAALAKRTGSLDAARRYMIAWRHVHRLDGDGDNPKFKYLAPEEAETVMRYITEANDFLWADFELARLGEDDE